MKKIFFCTVALSYLALAACNKTSDVPETTAQKKYAGSAATQLNQFVVEAAYTRDMIIHGDGKYDCSTSGKNCKAPKGKSSAQIQELAVLDNYISEGNFAGYFATEDWKTIFPEVTDEGLIAIAEGRIHIYKKQSVDETASYVLSFAQSAADVESDNVICVWQY